MNETLYFCLLVLLFFAFLAFGMWDEQRQQKKRLDSYEMWKRGKNLWNRKGEINAEEQSFRRSD